MKHSNKTNILKPNNSVHLKTPSLRCWIIIIIIRIITIAYSHYLRYALPNCSVGFIIKYEPMLSFQFIPRPVLVYPSATLMTTVAVLFRAKWQHPSGFVFQAFFEKTESVFMENMVFREVHLDIGNWYSASRVLLKLVCRMAANWEQNAVCEDTLKIFIGSGLHLPI